MPTSRVTLSSPPAMQLGPVSVLFGEKNGKYPDGNQVVVRGRERTALFDTPLASVDRDALLAQASLVILGHVHEDHTCALHKLPQVPVHVPDGDVAALRSEAGLLAHYGYSAATGAAMLPEVRNHFHFVPRPDAEGYADGQVWDLGGVQVRALHHPGHTAGHSVLLVEPQGIAFIGDIDLSSFGPYYGDATSNLRAFQRSLRALRDLPATAWITSHHKGVITERGTFLDLLAAFEGRLTQREAAILASLAEQPQSLEDLVAERFLFPKGYQGIYVEDAERQTIRQHLDLLEEQGRIVEERGRYRGLPEAAPPGAGQP